VVCDLCVCGCRLRLIALVDTCIRGISHGVGRADVEVVDCILKESDIIFYKSMVLFGECGVDACCVVLGERWFGRELVVAV